MLVRPGRLLLFMLAGHEQNILKSSQECYETMNNSVSDKTFWVHTLLARWRITGK
jgi:hypothetical protein